MVSGIQKLSTIEKVGVNVPPLRQGDNRSAVILAVRTYNTRKLIEIGELE